MELPIFIKWQCRLASWIHNFKHLTIRIEHCISVLICSPNIKLSMLHDLINLPIANLTTQFCAESIWHVACGWDFTIRKPIFKVVTYDFCRGMGIMACKMLWQHVLYFSYILMANLSLLVNFTALSHQLQFGYEHLTENTLRELITFFQSIIFFQASNFQWIC